MDDSAAGIVADGIGGELTELVVALRREVGQLRQEVADLRRENIDLRQQARYWQSRHEDAKQRIGELQQQVQELEAANRQLRQQAFGRSSEKASPSAKDYWQDLEEATSTAPRRRGQQAGRPGPRRRAYAELAVRSEIIELSPAERCCPQCGQAYRERTETEDAEQIEIEVQAYRRVLKRRRYHPQCRCRGPWQIVTAPAPPKLIAKSRYGISVWLEVLLDKFVSQRPTERLLEQWRLLGLDLAAGTVNGGLKRLEPLFTPLYQVLISRQQASGFWQGDETPWQVFTTQEGKVGHCWWLWVFVTDQAVVYRLDPSRSRQVPQAHLQHEGQACRGTLMVDRYAAYKAMSQVKNGQVMLAFCWAHVRRDFIRVGKSWPQLKEWALAWLQRIRELYRRDSQRRQALEIFATGNDPQPGRHPQAEQAVREHLQLMYEQAERECAQPELRQSCRSVLRSLLEHWPGLSRFIDDPRIPLDNNACERHLRGPVVGRKNYYGSGSLWSGRLAAMLFSLVGTLEKHAVNPRTWLTGYLHACAQAGGRPPPNLEKWLPGSTIPDTPTCRA